MIIAMSNSDYPWIVRTVDIRDLLRTRSVLLFGPRQTGKSTYVKRQLDCIEITYSLLDQGLLTAVLADPTIIRQEIEARDLRDCVVCIDEIQKCPPLMDEVQLLMERRNIRFLLTGSSARSLKRSGANMLGGRGSDRTMHVFTWLELVEYGFSLDRAINHGLLPPHYLSDQPDEGLSSYVDRYLTEEIAAEGLSRNLPGFARFLQTAATTNAQLINYSNVARDAQVSRQTVVQWYQVLYDTLVGFQLSAFTATRKRKAIETAKFYFFDTGIVRAIRRLPYIAETSADFGEFFEHVVFLEIKAWIDYRSPRATLHYWRSRSGYEVDFIVGGRLGIEAKATKRVQQKHLKGLRALGEEDLLETRIIVCREDRPRQEDGIHIWPLEFFLEQLWANRLMPVR